MWSAVKYGLVLARGVDLAQAYLGHAIPEVAQNQVSLGHRGIDLPDLREIQAVQTTPGYQRSGLLGPVRRACILASVPVRRGGDGLRS